MKTINYRGVLCVFQLPESWTQEYGSDGGGEFYDPKDESITLRLNVLTAEAPHDLAISEAAIAFTGSSFTGTTEQMPHLQSLHIAARTLFQERGEPRELHLWSVARVSPPRTLRIANFTITVAPNRAAPDHISQVLSMLGTQIRGAELYGGPSTSSAAPEPKPRRSFFRRLFGG